MLKHNIKQLKTKHLTLKKSYNSKKVSHEFTNFFKPYRLEKIREFVAIYYILFTLYSLLFTLYSTKPQLVQTDSSPEYQKHSPGSPHPVGYPNKADSLFYELLWF